MRIRRVVPLLVAFLTLLVGNYGVQHVKDISALFRSGVFSTTPEEPSEDIGHAPPDADSLVHGAVDDLVGYLTSDQDVFELFSNTSDSIIGPLMGNTLSDNEKKKKYYLESELIKTYIEKLYINMKYIDKNKIHNNELKFHFLLDMDIELSAAFPEQQEARWAETQGIKEVRRLFQERTRWAP